MKKNIIICCDGTSNDFGDKPSNVVRLFSVLEKVRGQIVYYDPGVGTTSSYNSFNPFKRKLKYILGNAFGYGLSENITEAYKFIMQCYEEGDQLYFFGFSRGAYTVRALAGLIDVCGLLHANCQNLVPEAMRIYSKRSLSYDKDGKNSDDSVAGRFKNTFGRNIQVHFLGLWDTVTSVGWVYNPKILQSTTNNKSVRIVRHAISIDERRAFFRQNLWGNRFEKEQDVKQVWFAGVHSNVGGSYAPEESSLSNIALEWMLVEAKAKGMLILDEKARESLRVKINGIEITDPHLQKQQQSLHGVWYIAEIWPKIIRKNLADRKQIEAAQKNEKMPESKWVPGIYFNLGRHRFMPDYKTYTLHESVLLRLQALPSYRPKNLITICSDINSFPEKFRIEKWVRL